MTKIAHLTKLTTFAAGRRAFRRGMRRSDGLLGSIPYPARGPNGRRLSVDYGYLGDPDADRLVIVVTGIHGVEGPCGSICLTDGLERGLFQDGSRGTAYLLVHGLNPWGYAWARRVNENGVDLNRNFRNHRQDLPNDFYREIEHLAVPRKVTHANTAKFLTNLGWHLITRGRKRTETMLLGGQRSDPLGLYYVGMRAQPSAAILARLLRRFSRPARKVVYLDVHSGLGAFGDLSLLHGYEEDDARRALATQLCEVEKYDANPGDSILFADRLLGAKAGFSGTLEFGTHDELSVLLALRAEHAAYREWISASPEARRGKDLRGLWKSAKERLTHAFAPRDRSDKSRLSHDWAQIVTGRFEEIIGKLHRLDLTAK